MFAVLCDVSAIQALPKKVLIFDFQGLKVGSRIPSISKMQIMKPRSVGDLLRNNLLPGPLCSEDDFSHTSPKQMKTTPLIRDKTLGMNMPA
jgi:hypothetical protein